jgi:hypothetical protein
MTELMRIPLERGGEVFVETEPAPGLERVGRAADMLQDATQSLEQALLRVRDAAAVAVTQFVEMPERPDEVELKFGIKLDAQAGAVIARTGLQGHFEVKLKWRPHSDHDAETP